MLFSLHNETKFKEKNTEDMTSVSSMVAMAMFIHLMQVHLDLGGLCFKPNPRKYKPKKQDNNTNKP